MAREVLSHPAATKLFRSSVKYPQHMIIASAHSHRRRPDSRHAPAWPPERLFHHASSSMAPQVRQRALQAVPHDRRRFEREAFIRSKPAWNPSDSRRARRPEGSLRSECPRSDATTPVGTSGAAYSPAVMSTSTSTGGSDGQHVQQEVGIRTRIVERRMPGCACVSLFPHGCC